MGHHLSTICFHSYHVHTVWCFIFHAQTVHSAAECTVSVPHCILALKVFFIDLSEKLILSRVDMNVSPRKAANAELAISLMSLAVLGH